MAGTSSVRPSPGDEPAAGQFGGSFRAVQAFAFTASGQPCVDQPGFSNELDLT
jgi:hypothetical protein